MSSYKVMLLFGPPGAGKGTQGDILGRIPGFHHLATGDMFRGLDPSTDLGQRVRGYSSRGELVPDELTVELWSDHVTKQIDAGEYDPAHDLLVLDGIPRSVAQAKMIDDQIEVLTIVRLDIPDIEPMVARMKHRACLQGRQDDADEAVIRRRFEVYDEETAPVLAYYPPELIHPVPALGTPVEVLHRILAGVAPICAKQFGNPLVE